MSSNNSGIFCKLCLAAFFLFVSSGVSANIAQEFGVASQGSDYGSSIASRAIDGDEGTANHTACNATGNWWQVELPNPSVISRVVVKNTNGWSSRLNGAEVYITNAGYADGLNETDRVYTLNSNDTQEITLATPKSGSHIIVKAAGSNCLHMREVEVYGEVPAAPILSAHDTSYLIAQTKPLNAVVITLEATDLQNDPISYSVVGTVPFSADPQGNIRVNGALTIGDSHTFDVNVSDGTHIASTTLTVSVKASTAPTFSGNSGHYAVAENAAINTSVGFVKANDVDDDDPLSYSIIETGTPFQIDAASGEITVSATIDRSAAIKQTITIAVTDQATSVEQEQTIFIVPAANANTTGILLEHWTGISGNAVSNLTSNPNYPANPTQTSILTSFEAPSQTYGSYGQRASGYLKVTESAEYTFWIASDDESELRLSTDTSAANMGDPIASINDWTSSQQWDKYTSQKSDPIYLVAGRLYYIEALHKEGSGGDHVAVALQKEGDATQTLITGSQVIPPYVVDSVAPTPPASLGADSVSESRVEFVWSPANDAIGIVNYNIYRDGVLIATVTDNILNYIDNDGTANTLHNYQVIAVDAFGNHSTAAELAVDTAVSIDTVEKALQTGDARYVLNDLNLIEAALSEINSLSTAPSLLADLYQAEQITYTQGQDTQIINLNTSAAAQGILWGNAGKTLAIAGTAANARYAAFGSVPMEMFEDYVDPTPPNNPDHPFVNPFNRLLAWLFAGQPINEAALNSNRKVALSFVDDYRTDIVNWLNSKHSGWTVVECNTVAELASCFSTADLVITGSQADDADAATIQQVLANQLDSGIPVMYFHTHGWRTNDVSDNIAELFGFTFPYGGNFRTGDSAAWDNVTAMYGDAFAQDGLSSIETMLQHFRDEDYNFDWSVCNYDICTNVAGLTSDFEDGATKVRSIISALDTSKQNIFTQEGLRFEKLLVLIGDRFRQDVQYPMDKVTTDDTAFMQSLYADHAAYNYRSLNPAQPDMGNFSRSDFSHIAPTTRTVNLNSKKNFRSTGAYALPGQTFKVTRNDNSGLTVKVFINTLRSEATHLYQTNGYSRPKYLQSPLFGIASGESIELTSTYGGPIQLSFDVNDLPVNITFENVGEHAYWATTDDDASFTAKLDAGEFDWAEIVTAGFEVHSTLEKMRQSISYEQWGNAQALAAGTERYMNNFPHVLAGFIGPGIDVVPEIHDFANTKGWTIDNLDLVKHMNADQASCGSGCSGNPYDAYWAYGPTEHGDVHELGHGLERSRFQFADWEVHSQTNPYSYYTKSKYHETTGGDPSCQSLPFEAAFNALQNSIGQTDVEAFMKTNYWDDSNWSHQVMMTIQMMMTTQKMGKLENGWHLLARLHIHDREFRRADNNDTDWAAKKDSLGFSDYTRTEAQGTSNNDYMLMALSTVAELDFRSYLSMWGISYSEKAANQVASYGYTSVPKEFFISAENGYCRTGQNGDFLAKATLAVDGSQIWPATTDTDLDGYWDTLDNCPAAANADQADVDNDGTGNACDPDFGVVPQGDQSISFAENTPSTKTVGDTSFAITAAGGASGETVVITSNTTTICSVNNDNVSILKAGTCSLAANQAGNDNYNAAPEKTHTISVGKGAQDISFAAGTPSSKVVGDANFAIAATGGSSGQSVVISSETPTICAINNGTVSIFKAGACTLAASQAGNDDYNAALPTTLDIAIGKSDQVISFAANTPTIKAFDATAFTVSATGGSSGLVVNITSQTETICSVNNSTVSLLKAGTCTLAANQAGNSDYNAALEKTHNISVTNNLAQRAMQVAPLIPMLFQNLTSDTRTDKIVPLIPMLFRSLH